MKSRAQARSSSESDDWGDESWTVDCPCGVNFDDGEEMVDCDECGVWVHTSCCRILKGRTSYVCDKCKSKKKKESEESEIAQVLVELPTKIPPFEEKNLEKAEVCPVPFRSAADLSMEERAHVHGIPGGDAQLFLGVSKVFSQQLWKSTGYIPKLLRFSYHELPEWPDERTGRTDFLPEAPKKESDDALLGGLKGDQSTKPEEERNSNLDTERQTDLQSEDRQSLKDKHGRREGRKGDSKHGTHKHKLHNLREDRGHHHNRRRREEGGQKESGSRKRVRNTANDAKLNEEILKKGGVEHDASLSVKATRGSPKNLKEFKKLAAQNYMHGDVKPLDDGKLEPLTAQDTQGLVLGDNSDMKIEALPGQDFRKPDELWRNASTYKKDHDVSERGQEFNSLSCTPVPNAPVTLESANDRKVGDEATALRKELDVSETMGQPDILAGKDHSTLDMETEVRIAATSKKEDLQMLAKLSCASDTPGSNKQVGATINGQSKEGTEGGKLLEDVELSSRLSIVGKVANEVDGKALKQNRPGASITLCSLSKEHQFSRIGSDSMEQTSELAKTFQKQSLPCGDHLASASSSVPFVISGPMPLLKDANSKSGKASLRGVKVEPGFEHFVADVKPNKSMNSPESSGSLVQGSSKNLSQSSGHMKDQGILDTPTSQLQGRAAPGFINSHQEHSKLLQPQSSVIPENALAMPLKHSLSEETIHAVKQHAIGQKVSSPAEAQNQHQHSSKQTESLRAKPAKTANLRHHVTTDTSHQQSYIDDQSYKESKEDFLHEQISRTDEHLLSQDGEASEEKMQELALKSKGLEQKEASPSHSTPFQQGYHQDETLHSRISANECPANVSGKAQTAGEEVLLPVQSISLRSISNANSSSPTSSSPGVAPKPHVGFLKSSSGSPPSEKSGNVLGIASQAGSSSKPNSGASAVSNSKPPFPLVTSAATLTSIPLKNLSVSKQRSKSIAVPDSRKPDVESNSTKPPVSSVPVHHSNEAGSPGLIKSSGKELAKQSANVANKSTDLGKSSSLPVLSKQPLPSKGHQVFPSSKQANQSSCKQESVSQEHVALAQIKQPMKQVLNNTSNKQDKLGMLPGHMASKAAPVLPPPYPMGTPERQILVTASAAPALNDEELALLLHQELNSSPRVPRVARVRHTATASQLVSSSQVPSSSIKRATGASLPAVSGTTQKEHNLGSRRRVRDDSSRESSRGSLIGAEEALKSDGCASRKHEVRVHSCNNKDVSDGYSGQKVTPLTISEASSPHSPLPVIAEGQSASDLSGANDTTGEKKGSAENILTLPGLIEEILSDKGHQASFDYICEAVFPHWQKLRKQNGERYAYTSHRQAVLDCLRNRAAWAHLIDRGPKTNIGRKRRRQDTAFAIESEIDDDADGINSSHDDDTDNCKPSKISKETDIDRNESCPPERVKDDMSLLEEVPKGKRKARRRRRPALQAKGDAGGGLHRKERRQHKVADSEEEQEPTLSPLSEEAASNYSEEEEEILVHRGSRHARRQGTSVDSGDDEMDA